MDELSEFLLYAALLLELKSQRLLPGPDDVDADEETLGWEERDVLLARLLECRAYAAVADALARQARGGRPLASPARPASTRASRSTRRTCLEGVTPPTSAAGLPAGDRRAARAPGRPLDHVTVDTVTVAETVDELARELPAAAVDLVPRARRRPHGPHRDHRALPGGPRAVQARPGHPRPGPHLRRPAHHLDRGRTTSSSSTSALGGRLCRLRMTDDGFALEAIVLVAIEPVTPASMLPTSSRRTAERVAAAARRAARRARARSGAASSWPRPPAGWRFQTPPRRPRARPALRQPRRLAPALDRRARDPRHRRVPPARLARPDRRAARRQRRRRRAPPRAARLHRGEGPRRGPGPAVLFGTTELFLDRLGLRSLDELPPIDEFLRAPSGGRARGPARPALGD